MNTADTEMGSDLDDIFNILNSEAKDELSASNVIIEHRWNYKKAAFEKWIQWREKLWWDTKKV